MKIKTLAPWFGGKRTLAPEIVRELGPHSAYWEPFCGGLSVLLAKPESSHETVNDLHGDLVNLARVVASEETCVELHRRLMHILAVEELIREYDDKVRRDEYEGPGPDVDRAIAFFVSSWMGRNGYCGLKKSERGRTVAVRWTPNGGHGGQRFASAVDSIPAWHQRLRNALILRRDALELLTKIDDTDGISIYVDPPYLVKSDDYLHDLADADHQRLAALLRRFRRTRVVVSYYEHPLLAEYYPGWTKRSFDMAKNTGHSAHRGRSGKRATEVLLLNGRSYVDSPTLF